MTTAATTHAVQLFGPPTFRRGDEAVVFLPDKRHQLLAYLAYRGTWVSRESLAELFWSGNSETVRGNLRRLLGRVQELDWLTNLEIERSRVRWNIPTDVADFVEGTEQVLERYLGPFLQGLESYDDSGFGNWLELERERLQGEWREAVLHVATIKEQSQGWRDASRLYRQLLERDPFDEEALQFYLASAASAGRAGEARRIYEAFAKRLERELGVEPTSRTLELRATLERSPTETILRAKIVQPKTQSLPTPSGSFIGRDLELAEIAHAFSSSATRFLTILGPGGAGKTRLALQAANELRGQFTDVYFAPLEGTAQIEQLPSAVAAAVNVELDPSENAASQIAGAIETESVLLVLDNFEHLVEGASLVSELLSSCPELRVIATSRERLNLAEELTLQLGGLSLPSAKANSAEAEQADGVRLFEARAKKASSSFALGRDELPSVVKICQLVEGFPLAIELAAAWTRALPCAEIAGEIAANLDFLASSSRNVNERHRSMRATFEYSWTLLPSSEQHLLQKLAVFRDGFTREAAVNVTGANLALLLALVDKSLLQSLSGRFRFHPLLQQYAQEKLTEDATVAAEASQRHALYMLHTAETFEANHGEQERRAMARLVEELENLRAALAWSLEQADRTASLKFAAYLKAFWAACGRVTEGRDFVGSALAHPDAAARTLLRAYALDSAGNLAGLQGDVKVQMIYYEENLAIAEELEDQREVASALVGLGQAALYSGNSGQALMHLERALRIARAEGINQDLSVVLSNLGLAETNRCNYAQARVYEEEALALDDDGQLHSRSASLNNIGLLHWYEGDSEGAILPLEEGLALAKRDRDVEYEMLTTSNLGAVYTDLGRHSEARSFSLKALSMRYQHTNHWDVPYSLENLACLALAEGDALRAAYLWGGWEALCQKLGVRFTHFWRERHDKAVAAARSACDPEAFDQKWRQGSLTDFNVLVNELIA